jgi:hypothetical protein
MGLNLFTLFPLDMLVTVPSFVNHIFHVSLGSTHYKMVDIEALGVIADMHDNHTLWYGTMSLYPQNTVPTYIVSSIHHTWVAVRPHASLPDQASTHFLGSVI